jgi:hypothetical protein
MARTTLTPIVLPGPWSTTAQPITFTPADTTNNNQFLATGQEILLVRNTGASAASFTVLSVPDSPYGRIGHLTQSVSRRMGSSSPSCSTWSAGRTRTGTST